MAIATSYNDNNLAEASCRDIFPLTVDGYLCIFLAVPPGGAFND